MKCKLKITSLVLAIALILGTTAFATVGNRAAQLVYNNIKIVLNGKEVIPKDANGNAVEPFAIDGTTYLPIRAISNALGLNVGWDNTTKTVTLDNPGVFQGAVQVYDDQYVTIEFAGCRTGTGYFSEYYYADFNIKNKTDVELTFQSDALSFDGVSYKVAMGSDAVAPQSTGKASFQMADAVPVNGIGKTSGQIRVIDFDYTLLENSYDAKWVNVTK